MADYGIKRINYFDIVVWNQFESIYNKLAFNRSCKIDEGSGEKGLLNFENECKLIDIR